MAQIVLVDDEHNIRDLFREILEGGGHTIFAEAASMEDAQGIVARCVVENIVPIFVVDGAFPIRGQGEELAQIIRKKIPEAKIISCSVNLQDWGDINLYKGPDAFEKLPRVVSSLLSGQT